MVDEVLKRDQNRITVLGGITDDSNQDIVMLRVDPVTKRLLISATVTSTANLIIGTSTITGGTTGLLLYDNAGVVGELPLATYPSLTELSYVKGVTSSIQTQLNAKGVGTVTAVSVATANGISGTSSGGATPALTIALGVITPTSVNGLTLASQAVGFTIAGGTTSKTLTVPLDASVSGTNTGDNANTTGNSGNIRLLGSSTGYTTFSTANAGATNYTLALPLADDTLVGKATTDSFTNKSIGAGKLTLEENASIALDPAGSADGKYTGITVTGVAGATVAFGDLITLDKDDSRWELVDISVAAAATGDARGILGMAVSAGNDGDTITILLEGIIRADDNFPTLTIGANVYASTTGDIVVAQPTTTDYVIRIIGGALTANEIFFRPDFCWTTHI